MSNEFHETAGHCVCDVSEFSFITIQEYEAGFCGVNGTAGSNHAGYTGSGFANTVNASR